MNRPHHHNRLLRSAIILAVSLHAASFAAADGPSDPEQQLLQRGPGRTPSAAARPRTFPADNKTSLLHMFWPLCAVLLVVVLSVLAIRKWMPQAARLGGGDTIKVLARHHLSGRQSLCLVRLGRRAVLLGVTNDRISALSQIDDPEEVAALVAAAQRARPGSFTTMLSKFTTADVAPNPDHPADDKTIQEGPLVSSQNLASTGQTIRGLIDRVRALSSQNLTPTESA